MALPSLNSEGLTLTDGNTLASIKQIVDLIYPIGSLYWLGNSTDPSTLFKGTTWTQIKDVFILAEGDDKTFPVGQKSVKLTTENLPSHQHWFTPQGSMASHTHPFSGTTEKAGKHSHYFGMNANPGGNSNTASDGYSDYTKYQYTSEAPAHTHSFSGNTGVPSSTGFSGSRTQTEATGKGTAFNIIPPYIKKYCWQRES